MKCTHFSPNKWIFNSIGQVLASRLLKCPRVDFERVIVPFQDGVNCVLDVARPVKKNADADANANADADSGPGTILFCPGYSGNTSSPYCSWFADAAIKRGYTVVIYNRRAHLSESTSPTYPMHFDQDDLDTAMVWTRANTAAPLYGVGVSAGGNILMCATASQALCTNNPFKAIVSVGNGYDIDATVDYIETKPFANRIITGFAREILENVQPGGGPGFAPHTHTFSGLERKALSCFNEYNIYMPAYYKSVSSASVLEQIEVPTLCINSLDDILLCHSIDYLINMTKRNMRISIILPSHGGHVGFVGKDFKCDWWCQNTLEFLDCQAFIN